MSAIDNLNSTFQGAVKQLGLLITAIQNTLLSVTGNATSATSGAASALPTTPAGYFTMINPTTGKPVKVPFYNP